MTHLQALPPNTAAVRIAPSPVEGGVGRGGRFDIRSTHGNPGRGEMLIAADGRARSMLQPTESRGRLAEMIAQTRLGGGTSWPSRGHQSYASSLMMRKEVEHANR